MALEDIYNYVRISEDFATSGLPTRKQFAEIADAGFAVVINLLPEDERMPDEQALVESLGMEYVYIPVVWTAPAEEDLVRFFAAMDANKGRQVFVHCAANMRVSAFTYLYRILRLGVPEETARADRVRIWEPDEIWQAFIAARQAEAAASAAGNLREWAQTL